MEEQNTQHTSYEEDFASSDPETQPEPAAPEPDHRRTVSILAVALAVVAACLCVMLAFTAGFSILGGGSEPEATATPVPTPEPGQPPQAVIDAQSRAIVDEEILFDGSSSQPAAGSAITGYLWDFGDGTQARGISVRYAYARAGKFTATLTVTDNSGLSDTARFQITISEPEPTATPEPSATPSPTATAVAPPEAIIQGPSAANVGEVVTFDGRSSTSGNPVVNYAWDFGDRTQGNGAVVDHVYRQAGSYVVTLTVTDNAGQTGSTTVEITIDEVVQNPPQAAISGPTEAAVRQDVTFDGSGSQPGSSDIVDFAWDFGNGETKNGPNEVAATTRYSAPGQYTVSLTVTDANGLSNETRSDVVVNARLEGTTWNLTTVLPGSSITLELNNGQVSGSSGCNSYQGSYVLDDGASSGAIGFSGLTTTQQLCDDEVMGQEGRYLAALAAVNSYQVRGGTLSLAFPGGVLTYADQPPTPEPR